MLRWRCRHLGFIILQWYCEWRIEGCDGQFNHEWISLTKTPCGVQQLCCIVPNPFESFYWKGTAPLCNANCLDCNDGDYCILKHSCGDGSSCDTRWGATKKYLCGYSSQPLLRPAMEESDPGLVLPHVNYEKIIMDNWVIFSPQFHGQKKRLWV